MEKKDYFFGFQFQSPNGARTSGGFTMSFEAMILIGFFTAVIVIGLAHAFKAAPATVPTEKQTEEPVELAVLTLADIATPFTEKEKRAHKAKPKRKTVVFDPEREAYVRRFQKTAILEMKRYGVPASISMAQGIIESRSGTSEMAVAINNHFGMKCHLKSCTKGHCANYADDSSKDFFKRYNNAWESWRAHSLLLTMSSRYKGLVGSNYKEWAYGLKKGGYATTANYAEDLIALIEKYDLQRLDKEQLF